MIDLTSDTSTRPTPAMREAMAAAPVGDEQRREDPTVNKLQEMSAALLGKEAALFLPSGTMCNAIGFAVNAGRGDAVILDREAHPNQAEGGGPAWLANVMMRPIDSPRGIFTADQVRELVTPRTTHAARSAMVSVENTTNHGGGAVWPLDRLAEIRAVCDAHGMRLHMDGARLLNAVVAADVPASVFAACADSVWFDLSKGLGAPVGGVLAGSTEFIEQARLLKHLFGGAMRQAGIIAAAGVYALEHHVERLAEDHANAKLLAAGLAAIPGITLVHGEPETNIVFFDVAGTGLTPAEIEAGVNARGIRFGANYDFKTSIRAVTHLDVSRADCEAAVAAVREIVLERAPVTAA